VLHRYNWHYNSPDADGGAAGALMVFQVAVVYYSLHGRLVTTANVVAEGARKVLARLCAQPSPTCRRGVPQQGLHSFSWAPGRLRAAGGR